MINCKKGTAFSLQQADIRGLNPNASQYGSGSPTITAGELVYVAPTTYLVTAVPTTGGASFVGLKGFAMNNNYDGDAIESGKIAIYTLDGNSIIETDQVDLTADSTTSGINLTNYPVGTPMYPSGGTAGLVSKINGSAGNLWPAPIGWVEGVRSLPNATPYPSGTTVGPQNYTSATEAAAYAANSQYPTNTPSTKAAYYKAQVSTAVLAIKLASN